MPKEVEHLYPYSFKIHQCISDENNFIKFLCFCREQMVTYPTGLKCAKNKCGFCVTNNVLKNYPEHEVFKSNSIKIPICRTCNGCVFDCYTGKLYPDYYLKPKFGCKCPEPIKVTPSLYGGNVEFEKYFSIPKFSDEKQQNDSSIINEMPDA